jgi:general secretion pathway protein M
MNDLKQQLYARLAALSPRDRIIALAAGALLMALIFYLAVLLPLHNGIDARATRVTHKQADLAWMRSVAGDLQALGTLQPGGGANSESLVVLIDRSAHESGLGDALTGQTPNGNSSIRVRLEGATFDTLVQWLGKMQQQYGVAVESAAIDRTGKPGVVNVSLVLNRA